TKNRSGKDQKIAQSTHENGYIKPRKTFWRNSKQLLNVAVKIGNIGVLSKTCRILCVGCGENSSLHLGFHAEKHVKSFIFSVKMRMIAYD
ncbi:hypothetical protein B5F71_17590, partial [Bacteroides sp. An269]